MSRRDASADDMSYAVKLANRGFSEAQIFRALSAKPDRRRREPGSMKYLRLLDTHGADRAEGYARRTAQKALAFVEANPAIVDRSSALVKLLELEAVASALPWGVYGGPGLRRALEAAFLVAERVGGLSFGLSVREHAELAGHGFEQARADRRGLEHLGWLRRNPNDRLGRTARYTLRRPLHIHSHQGDLNVANDRRWLSHDAFRAEALGDEAWLLLSLAPAPISVRDLSLRTGFDQEHLGGIVSTLGRFDLVHLDDEGMVRRSEDPLPQLVAASTALGTVGALDADRERYETERAAFRGRDVNVEVGAE